MEYGNLYKTVRLAKSHDYKCIEVDYDLVPPHPGYACCYCLTYFDIKDIEISKGRPNGICKPCRRVLSKTHQQTPRGKIQHTNRNIKYYKTPKGKATQRRKQCKQTLLKTIKKDLYGNLTISIAR